MASKGSFADNLAAELKPHTGKDNPVALIKKYFGDNFSGAEFDRYGSNAKNGITSDDLIAVTMLSIPISSNQLRGITPKEVCALMNRSDEIGALLRRIPSGPSLEQLSGRDFDRYLAPGSPADDLYELILGIIPRRRVATNKLIARKRPALLPVHDTVVRGALGKTDNFWKSWWQALHERGDIVDRLKQLRHEADKPHLSLLRVADIVIWMRHRVP